MAQGSLPSTRGQGGPEAGREELWVGAAVVGAAAAELAEEQQGPAICPCPHLPPLSLPDASQQGPPSQAQWLSETGEDGTCVGARALACGPTKAQRLSMPTF